MGKSQRLEGQVVAKKIVYGSVAVWRSNRRQEDQRTHKWTVYVRGPQNEDLSYFIRRVQFDLHPSFEESTKLVDNPPFEVTETGWGEFEIKIKIFFHEVSEERPLELTHYLKLHSTPFPQSTSTAHGGSMRPSLLAQNVQKRVPVVAEKYDEVLFVEPVEAFYELLMKGGDGSPRPISVVLEISSHGHQFIEEREVSRLEEAKAKLKAQIAQLRDKYQQEEETLSKYIDETESLAAQIRLLQEQERLRLREAS
eukprot:GGOE01040459.1.p1 GENE.GGOE01040459.1~~GGOE01040459.1.p1  ORF type:complete len:264 (-),score=97.81 GGOE01040459.1:248-1006(-)